MQPVAHATFGAEALLLLSATASQCSITVSKHHGCSGLEVGIVAAVMHAHAVLVLTHPALMLNQKSPLHAL